MLQCMNLAMHQVLHQLTVDQRAQLSQDELASTPPAEQTLPLIHICIVNFTPTTQLRRIKANYIGSRVGVML